MKKNIGLLIPSLNSGGAERVVSRLSKILSDEYNVFVILFEDTFLNFECGGTMINMDIKSQVGNKFAQIFLPYKRSRELKKIKKQLNLAVVISFMDSPNVVNLLSRVNGCNSIISIRNYDYDQNNVLIRKILKQLYRKADAVVSVTKIITQLMISEFDVPPQRAITIYNPYDIEQINNQKSIHLKKNHNKFFGEGFIFITVGRHMYQKGFWHLIKAFKIVHDKYPNVKLAVIGRDEMKGKVQNLVNDLCLENNVLIMGFDDNPFIYIAKSHVYVLSSLYEGFPNSLLEAMGCACPVIAADCKTGPREILYENPDLSATCIDVEVADYGILTRPMESEENWDLNIVTKADESLAKAMIMMIENDKLREQYSKKSLNRAKYFDYEKCKNDYINVIENKQ